MLYVGGSGVVNDVKSVRPNIHVKNIIAPIARVFTESKNILIYFINSAYASWYA